MASKKQILEEKFGTFSKGATFKIIGNISNHSFETGATVRFQMEDTDGDLIFEDGEDFWYVNPKDVERV